MADWTNLPNSAVGVGGLPSGTTVTALRDNPIAIVEGAPGAPRITGASLAKTNDGLPVLSVTAADTYTLTDGLEIVVGTINMVGTTPAVARTITVRDFTGSIRFSASHDISGGNTSTLQIYKNNTLVQSWNTSSTTPQNRSVDISIVPGDVVEWRHFSSNALSGSDFSSPLESASNGFVSRPVLEPAI